MILAVSAATTMIHALTTQSVDIVLAGLLLVGGVVGAQYGAVLATRMKPDLLRLALAVVILLVALRMVARPRLAAGRNLLGRVSVRRALRSSLLALLAPLADGAGQAGAGPRRFGARIEIRYSFTGAQLLLFGAILYPGGRVPDARAGHRRRPQGPVQPILVREKQKIAGIWMNADSARFRSAPAYYAVASSQPDRRASR